MADYRLVLSWELAADDRRQIGLALTGAESLDEGVAEAIFDTWWNALDIAYDPLTVFTGYTWYEGVAGSPGSPEWGDAFRVTARSLPGTEIQAGFAQLPPQLAVVVSFPMPLDQKRHRGRVYMPAPSSSQVTDQGRFLSPGFFADTWKTALDALYAADWQPSVLAFVNGLPAFLGIQTVRVNNNFDTQRRRAYESSTETQTRALVVS